MDNSYELPICRATHEMGEAWAHTGYKYRDENWAFQVVN